MLFDKQDVRTRVYTNWSVIQVLSVHIPTGLSATYEEEYTGDSWIRAREKSIELLEREFNLQHRKERKRKNEKAYLPPQR